MVASVARQGPLGFREPLGEVLPPLKLGARADEGADD